MTKIDQYGSERVLPINGELLELIDKWRISVGSEGYIIRSLTRHGHIANTLDPASIQTTLNLLQQGLGENAEVTSVSGQSYRVGAARDLLKRGEAVERILLKEGG